MLTPKVLELGYRQWSGLELADVAKPHLERLLAETGEPCSVSVLDGDTIVFVARSAPVRLMGVAPEVGRRLPAYATAQGRVLLSSVSPSELSRFLDSADLRPLTRSTIVGCGELQAALGAIRHGNGHRCPARLGGDAPARAVAPRPRRRRSHQDRSRAHPRPHVTHATGRARKVTPEAVACHHFD
jgi:hypothetical protein